MSQGHSSRSEMVDEVTAAASFVASLLKMKGVDEHQLQMFQTCLQDSMSARYQHHWYPDKPTKGSAYRCIRINKRAPMDPLLTQAANRSGLAIKPLLPLELTLWVDPNEVSYRIGEDGSCGILYPRAIPSEAKKATSSPVASPVPQTDLPYDKNHFVMMYSGPIGAPMNNNQMEMYYGPMTCNQMDMYYRHCCQIDMYYRPRICICNYQMPTMSYRPCYRRMPIY